MDNNVSQKKKEIAGLIEKAKGNDRTYSTYAEEAGISSAAMSRLINGDYLPSLKTISKLVSKEADPRNNVTYDDFMDVLNNSSFQSEEEKKEEKQFYETYDDRNIRYLNAHKPLTQLVYNGAFSIAGKRDNKNEAYLKYRDSCIVSIYNELLGKEVHIKPSIKSITDIPAFKPHLCLDVFSQNVSTWIFYFLFCPKQDYRVNPKSFFDLLGGLLRIKLEKDTKVTFIVNQLEFFEWMKKYKYSLGFRGELSLVLYDESKEKLTEEFYLSNYDLDDQENEIYIV